MFGLGLTSGAAILLLIVLLNAAGVGTTQGAAESSWLFTEVVALAGRPSLAVALAAFVGVTAFQGWLSWRQSKLVVGLTQDVMLAMRQQVFTAICHAPWTVFCRHRSSDLLESLVARIDRIGQATYALLTLCASAATAIVLTTLAFNISAPMTLTILGAGALLTAMLADKRRKAAQVGQELTGGDQMMFRALTESLASMKIVRSYGAEHTHIAGLRRAGMSLRDVHLRFASNPVAVKLSFDVGAAIILSLVAWVSIRALGMAPAELFVLLVLFVRLTPQLSSLHVYFQGLITEMPAYVALTDLERQLHPPVGAAESAALSQPIRFGRDIRLEQVTFGYAEEPVLREVNLQIPAGGAVAIVGPSGAGKSTLADIVLGLLPPQTGHVVVDGVDLTRERLQAWRDQIAYVPQETFLFHDTVRQNLRWAAPGVTDRQIWIALTSAAADDFVRRLPNGLETVVGDRGVLLSGGERQRLALARALLRRPRLLILDEATSSLDSENERVVQDAIERLRGTVAILIIAHRLSTVRQADKIYVLEGGQIVESGNWDALMARPAGRFRALCLAQGVDTARPGAEAKSAAVI
jgi:ATP-binding cassette, subfamily C, bacterial